MAVRIAPLGTGDFAAEVRGADLAAIDAALAATLRRAAREHPVLVLRSAGLTPAELLALAGIFGEPQVQLLEDYRSSDSPLISIIASDQTDARGDGRRIVFGGAWHTDDSYLAVPAKATMLYAQVIPPTGRRHALRRHHRRVRGAGPSRRAELEGARAVHTYQSRRNMNTVPTRTASEEAQTPPVVHPLVRTDRDTGRRSLYLNPNRMEAVVGLDGGASDALLDRAHRARHPGPLRVPACVGAPRRRPVGQRPEHAPGDRRLRRRPARDAPDPPHGHRSRVNTYSYS